MTTLNELREAERARILDIDGDDAVCVRLLEMGFTEGEEVEVVGFAPFGDPIEYRLRGYQISLRASEASRLRVERIGV